jgi:hypothetical protein
VGDGGAYALDLVGRDGLAEPVPPKSTARSASPRATASAAFMQTIGYSGSMAKLYPECDTGAVAELNTGD